MSRRLLLVLLILVIGSVQAWDSNVFSAGPVVQVLMAIGILLQAAVVAAIGLSFAARMASPVPLPGLTLAVVFPALVIWLNLYYDATRGAGRPVLGNRG